jgi:hypothetical protein
MYKTTFCDNVRGSTFSHNIHLVCCVNNYLHGIHTSTGLTITPKFGKRMVNCTVTVYKRRIDYDFQKGKVDII